MADSKQHIGEPDRGRVSGSEAYEVRYFAERHGLSMEQARDLIRQHGEQRDALEAAAERLKRH